METYLFFFQPENLAQKLPNLIELWVLWKRHLLKKNLNAVRLLILYGALGLSLLSELSVCNILLVGLQGGFNK